MHVACFNLKVYQEWEGKVVIVREITWHNTEFMSRCSTDIPRTVAW